MTKEEKAYEQNRKAKIEYMRSEVQETELQARYWKAQYELKQYTLLDAGITEEYQAYATKMQEGALKQMQDSLAAETTEAESEPALTAS